MTKDELLTKLSQVLTSFEDPTTIVEVHLTFTDLSVGKVVPLHPHKEERWWDENLQMWLPSKPEGT